MGYDPFRGKIYLTVDMECKVTNFNPSAKQENTSSQILAFISHTWIYIVRLYTDTSFRHIYFLLIMEPHELRHHIKRTRHF